MNEGLSWSRLNGRWDHHWEKWGRCWLMWSHSRWGQGWWATWIKHNCPAVIDCFRRTSETSVVESFEVRSRQVNLDAEDMSYFVPCNRSPSKGWLKSPESPIFHSTPNNQWESAATALQLSTAPPTQEIGFGQEMWYQQTNGLGFSLSDFPSEHYLEVELSALANTNSK